MPTRTRHIVHPHNNQIRLNSRNKRPLPCRLMISFKVWMEKDGDRVFSDGKRALLEAVDRLGSLNKAAQAMRMSYRTAWGKMRETERQLGFKLLDMRVGGDDGGGATLTPEAFALLDEFDQLKQSIGRAIARQGQLAPNEIRQNGRRRPRREA